MDYKSTPIEGNGNFGKLANITRYVQFVGLDAVTISKGKPYFFLFIDIDTKDREILRSALNICRQNRLTVYFYESCKGWHIISPCLLSIRKWSYIKKVLGQIQDYSGDTIRWTPRDCDGKILFYESWNTGKRQIDESYDLHFALTSKFMVDVDLFKECFVSSTLEWNVYNQLHLIK